jgi:hypothetical protein
MVPARGTSSWHQVFAVPALALVLQAGVNSNSHGTRSPPALAPAQILEAPARVGMFQVPSHGL